jgi:YesN/AraC family two-component response regulator
MPSPPTASDLHILHLVYETKPQNFDNWKTLSYYRMHFVLEGEGVLHTQIGDRRLSPGDVFFCLPSTPYALQSIQDFRYAYIGYLGDRANATAHKFNISVQNCVFTKLDFLQEIWDECKKIPSEFSDLYAEGVFLCTISAIAARTLSLQNEKKETQTAAIIKKYIDENFTNADLSLNRIADALSYNAKYISAVFKKHFLLSFKEYLNTIRINNACALMDKGFISVKDIAFLCGFKDPLYFSKVFKCKISQAPSEYITEKRKQK